MTLLVGVSRRNLPSLDLHMREADCEAAPPLAGCVLVAQSEQKGGGVGDWPTAGISLACDSRHCGALEYTSSLLTHTTQQPNMPCLQQCELSYDRAVGWALQSPRTNRRWRNG